VTSFESANMAQAEPSAIKFRAHAKW